MQQRRLAAAALWRLHKKCGPLGQEGRLDQRAEHGDGDRLAGGVGGHVDEHFVGQQDVRRLDVVLGDRAPWDRGELARRDVEVDAARAIEALLGDDPAVWRHQRRRDDRLEHRQADGRCSANADTEGTLQPGLRAPTSVSTTKTSSCSIRIVIDATVCRAMIRGAGAGLRSIRAGSSSSGSRRCRAALGWYTIRRGQPSSPRMTGSSLSEAASASSR